MTTSKTASIGYIIEVRMALGRRRCMPIITDSEMPVVNRSFANDQKPEDVAREIFTLRSQW